MPVVSSHTVAYYTTKVLILVYIYLLQLVRLAPEPYGEGEQPTIVTRHSREYLLCVFTLNCVIFV